MGKKTLQMITPKEALDLLKEGKQICIIKEYSLEDELSVMELLTEDLAAVVEQDAPEAPKKSGGGRAPKKKLDWGKIKALADSQDGPIRKLRKRWAVLHQPWQPV